MINSYLDRKLWRDLRKMAGQVVAVSLVIACGLAMLIMARSLIYSLESQRQEYYDRHRFADLFAVLKRAPRSVEDRVAELPGVAVVQSGVSVQVTLDLPGLDEPASGMVRSLPDHGEPRLNRLFLRRGRWLNAGARGEVLVGEAFAMANRLNPGDRVAMLLKGRREEFTIAGIVLSPEFIFEARPGAALPDNRTYGIFWMPYEEVSKAYDLYGAFNSLALTLAPGASAGPVIAEIDRLLTPYGGRGAYGRADHPSHIRVSDEIRVLQTLSIGFPLVFLSVAAFMTNAVLSRLLTLQREQIAILKAFGFTDRQLMLHFLKYALVMVSIGTVFGTIGGAGLGKSLVNMYTLFFRFPELAFRFDRSAMVIAFLVASLAAIAGVMRSVRRAAALPPAEAMRPEPPASFRPSVVERSGVGRWFSHSFRIAMRNLERRPVQALFTVAGLALATGILIVPNSFRDSVGYLLGFQWDVLMRDDVTIGLVEPASREVEPLLRGLPGVILVEPMRTASVRVRNGSRHRQLGLTGIGKGAVHLRILDKRGARIEVPERGMVVSSKLGELLGVGVGDEVEVEVLEGKRPVEVVKLVGLSEDLTGIAAYMEIGAVNRLLGEGDLMTAASISIDMGRRAEFLKALKGIPKVSWVGIKETLRENFKTTTAASINLIQSIYLTFATIVAFGVVYNNARISLAERARELATLRVIGFSQREVGGVLVMELVALAMMAVPLGLLLGTGFAMGIVQMVNTETVRLPLVLTPQNYAMATLTVFVASTVSAVLVLRRLHRLDLVGALKAPE